MSFFLLKQRRHHCCIPTLRGREEVAKPKDKLQKFSIMLFQEIQSHLYTFATCKTLFTLEEFQINRSTATSIYYANIYLARCGEKLKRKKNHVKAGSNQTRSKLHSYVGQWSNTSSPRQRVKVT